jgi:hypothetical protein
MTTVYVPYTVTGQDGEPVELELAAELSVDGEVIGLEIGRFTVMGLSFRPVPDWALRQLDMGDLAEEVRRRLQARERGWP